MRSPIAKKIWETHECDKFWFGYDVTFVRPYTVRPSVRTQSHNANAHVFVWREVTWRDSLARCVYNRNAKADKKHKDNLYVYLLDMLTNVERRKREKKKTKKRRRLSKLQRGRERRIAS